MDADPHQVEFALALKVARRPRHAIEAISGLAAVSHVYSKVIGEMLLIQINDDHQFTPQLEALPFRERVSEDTAMDEDRVVGSAKQIKGAVKQVVGKRSATPSWRRKATPTRLRVRFRTPSAASRIRSKENRTTASLFFSFGLESCP
jgi:hypothetical protein